MFHTKLYLLALAALPGLKLVSAAEPDPDFAIHYCAGRACSGDPYSARECIAVQRPEGSPDTFGNKGNTFTVSGLPVLHCV